MLYILGVSILLAHHALAGVIDFTIPSISDTIINEVDSFLHRHPSSFISADYEFNEKVGRKSNVCTLRSKGDGDDDTDTIEEVFKKCGKDSVIRLLDER